MTMKAERQQKERTSRVIQPSRGGGECIVDNRTQTTFQAKLIPSIQKKENGCLQRIVIQLADWYDYGNGGITPHIHCYSGGDSHLKIFVGGRVRRYNIVQNGRVHVQAREALEAASGNDNLIKIIRGLIDEAGGEVETVEGISLIDSLKSMLIKWGGLGSDSFFYYDSNMGEIEVKFYAEENMNEEILKADDEIQESNDIYNSFLETGMSLSGNRKNIKFDAMENEKNELGLDGLKHSVSIL